jgi:hypothetical protein
MMTFVASHRRKDGADLASATWNGCRFDATAVHGSALGKLARQLVEAGCPDEEWRMVGEDRERRLFGGSLHTLAGLSVWEDDRNGVRFAKYVPRAIQPNVATRRGGLGGIGESSPQTVDAPCALTGWASVRIEERRDLVRRR